MRILIVDDEPQYRLLMRSLLQDEGWDVLLAENGEDALEKIKSTAVDLIVSDVYMPVMDGVKLHKAVRARPESEKVPFLFMSAYDDQHTISCITQPRIEGFFKKGRSVVELKQWIRYLTAPEGSRPMSPPGQD
jgi:two-component system sensor histidine kinase/response regulator